RRTQRVMGAALVGLALVAASAFLFLRSTQRAAPAETASSVKDITFMQLTDQAGREIFPSLAPDGRSFVYAARGSGNWDIYLQRVGGKNPINLTGDCSAHDIQPAFSPDGEQIAFRSERKG